MFKRLGIIGMMSFWFLAFSVNAEAAAWQPVSGTHDGNALYGLYSFEDGVHTAVSFHDYGNTYPEVDGEWVLSNSTDPSKTSYLFSFRGLAPQVNLTNHTIDLSGMYLHGVNPFGNNRGGKFDGWIYDQAIGWKVSPSVWRGNYGSGYYYDNTNPLVPLVDNGNGTYTAKWSYANDVFSFDGPALSQMSLTFQSASPVPAPAAIWLFISGLSGLFARFHWRAKVSQLGVA